MVNAGNIIEHLVVCRHAARFAFHSSMLDQGVNQFNAGEVDIWRANIDKNGMLNVQVAFA